MPVLPVPALGGTQRGVLHPAFACMAEREAGASVFGLCAQRDGDQCKGLGLALHLQAVAQFAALPHAIRQARGVVTGDAGRAFEPVCGFGQGKFGQGALTFLLGMLVIGQRNTAEYGDQRHDEQQFDEGETTKDVSHGDKESKRTQSTVSRAGEGRFASSGLGRHKACQPDCAPPSPFCAKAVMR